MKKNLLSILLLSTALVFSGCGNASDTTADTSSDNTSDTIEDTTEDTTQDTTSETINIVATSFHEYDWLLQVMGDNADQFNVTLLNDSGIDLHSYEPTIEDISIITTSDLFIYNGGESDTWVDDILATNTSLNTVNVIEVLDDNALMSVLVEGMEEDEDHDHDDEDTTEEEHDHDDEDTTEEEHDHDDEDTTEEEHDHDDEDTTEEEHDHDDDEESEESHSHTDEHIWLSLDNAAIVCAHFADVLSTLDADNADSYQANADSYIAQLDTLDEAYEAMVDEAARDTIIVTDRFPFLYLMTDYDINYYAAFEGCSAETEASFETLVFLAEKADEYDVNYVLIVENGLEDLATTVINNSSDSSREILVLNSMQSISQSDIDAGVTYYSIMEDNLAILTTALAQ